MLRIERSTRFQLARFRKMAFSDFAAKKFTGMTLREKSMEEIKNHLGKFTGGSVHSVKREDGIAVVSLDRGGKKNAMTGKMMADLHDAVNELSSWTEGKGIILMGNKNDFCSGGDLDFVRQINTAEEGFAMAKFMQNTLSEFQRLPMISVALIEGIGALGGGAEMTVACDFRLLTETCQGIGFVHGKMGILPAWGGTNRLVEKVGYSKALEILSLAKIYGPSECLKIGLVDEIVPKGENAAEFAVSWLKKRIGFDAELIRCIKESVSRARDSPRDYETERRIFAPFWGGKANREALQKNIKHKRNDSEEPL